MKKIYSTLIIPENQDNLILSFFFDGIIYHIWQNDDFVVIKEFKIQHQKAMILNMKEEELKNMLYHQFNFFGKLNDERILYFNYKLWNDLGF
jgi:hypothetical protein